MTRTLQKLLPFAVWHGHREVAGIEIRFFARIAVKIRSSPFAGYLLEAMGTAS